MKHRIQSAMVCFAMLFLWTGCNPSDAPPPLVDTQDVQTKPHTTTAETTTAAETTQSETETTAASTEEETAAVSLQELFLRELEAHQKEIHLKTAVLPENVSLVLQQILSEHPELFWIKQWSCVSTVFWTDVEIETELSSETIAEMADRLDAAVQEVVNRVPVNADAYTQALFVHDYLVTHTDYDQEAAAQPEVIFGATAYDCLVEHKAVCSGYSKAYQLILQRLGIESGICSGVSRGESHAWNYVKIDGKYYWVDVTFDDPVSTSEEPAPDNLEHSFFMINDDMLLRTRTLGTEDLFVPVCDSLEQNYYVRNGCFLETYSPESVDAILLREADHHRAEIMFATSEECQKAITDLLDHENIWNLQAIQNNSGSELHYQVEYDMNMLCLFY